MSYLVAVDNEYISTSDKMETGEKESASSPTLGGAGALEDWGRE